MSKLGNFWQFCMQHTWTDAQFWSSIENYMTLICIGMPSQPRSFVKQKNSCTFPFANHYLSYQCLFGIFLPTLKRFLKPSQSILDFSFLRMWKTTTNWTIFYLLWATFTIIYIWMTKTLKEYAYKALFLQCWFFLLY